jgi:hypothetical protein
MGITGAAVVGIAAEGANAQGIAAVTVTPMKRKTKALEAWVEARTAVAQGAVLQVTVAALALAYQHVARGQGR